MQAKFVNRDYDCATIKKVSVRTGEGFESIQVIGVYADYGHKDELRAWAEAHGGGWHPVEKFWYVPVSLEGLKSLKDLSFFKGDFYLPHPKAQAWVSKYFDEAPTTPVEGQVYKEFSVFPEQERDYMSDYTTLKGVELPQMQGWVEVRGVSVRVLVLEKKPLSTEIDADYIGCEPRQYSREDGTMVWCIPWVDPCDRHDLPSWPDEDIEIGRAPTVEDAPRIILEIKALVQDGEVVGARAYCKKGGTDYHWNTALNWCKAQPGRKWVGALKAWDIPVTDELIKSICVAKDIDFQGGVFSFSQRLLDLANEKNPYKEAK